MRTCNSVTHFLAILPLVQSMNIVDFDTCNIPYIIPLSFQNSCDRSDEYLSTVAITNGAGSFITGVTPPSNITASSIRSQPNLWTQEPFCVESVEANKGFCVYTNDRFANGRGISIVATPQEIMGVIKASVFKKPSNSPDFLNADSNAHKQEHREIPGKGLGVVAREALNRGDRLQSYTPVLMIQDDMIQYANDADQELLVKLAVERLPPRTQDNFNALHAYFRGNPYLSRIKTNGFSSQAGTAKDYYWAILPESSRYNHDCRPNSAYYFDRDALSHHVNVVKKVAPGEEITVTYTHSSMKHATRQAYIHREWGFKCTCSACSAPKPLVAISDARLDIIADMQRQLDDVSVNRTGSLKMAETLVSLYEQENLHGVVGDAYMYAALEAAYLGEREGVLRWVWRALEALVLWRGEGHEFSRGMDRLAREMEGHVSWGFEKRGFRRGE